MDQAGQERRLFGPMFGGGGGHLRLLVPTEHCVDRGQHGRVAGVLANLLIEGGNLVGHAVILGMSGVISRC